MFKKIALIVAFVGLTLGLGFLLYRFFFAPAPPAPPPTGAPAVPPVTGLPVAAPGAPTPGVPAVPGAVGLPTAAPSAVAAGGRTQTRPVTTSAVLSLAAGTDGTWSYYDRGDGKFYRLAADGSVRALSESSFPSARQVTWSPDAGKAIIEFPDDSKIVYDFERQKQVTLPKHWQDFSFTGDGSTIVTKSMGFDPDNRWLIAVKSDGTGAKLIEPLGENADKVIVNASPDGEVVAFSDTADPIGFDSKEYHVIGQNGEDFKTLRVDGFGFMPKWTPDGERLLYSAATQGDGYRPSLWLVNAKGQAIGSGRTNLGIHTWADKCAFGDDVFVYCAVPDILPTGAGLQREVAFGIPDTIYKIDLRSGSTTVVGRPEEDATMTSLAVAPDGSQLMFTDQRSGALRSMRLR